MSPKRLFIFCDGTGQDGMVAPDGPTEILDSGQAFIHGVAQMTSAISGPSGASRQPEGGGDAHYVTNVLRLSRAVKPYSSDETGNIPQIVYYQSGVGSESDFLGSIDITTEAVLQGLGRCVASKIRDAYGFLAQNFDVGDEIFLFGFSRGAYTARKLAQLIDDIGLLTTENLGLFFNIWKELFDGGSPVIPSDTRVTRIRCICVWDTVEAIKEVDALHLKDTVVPASVDVALHALSLQENRKEFRPTFFTLADGSNQVLKECWFPGAHSDVGGSYPRHELADISLFWMAGEIKNLSLFDLDYDFIERNKQPSPRDDWGSSQPHNAYDETPWWLRIKTIHAQNRFDSGDITSSINYHLSWKYAPDQLSDPYDMVTRSILEATFGATTYVDLNDYEKGCKDRWNDVTNEPPVIYDDVSLLFPSSIDWVSSASVASMNSYQQVGGGSEATGSALYVGRASYKDGIHPGKVDVVNSCIYIGWGGDEIKLTDFDDLIEKQGEDSVGWYRVVGALTQDVLGGITLVQTGQESDGTALYSARSFYGGGLPCGKVKMGVSALIPYSGHEYTLDTYNVLVFKSELYFFHNAIGKYETKNNWEAVKQGSINSDIVTITPAETTPPRIVVGLNKVDMGNDADDSIVRVNAYVDSVGCNEFRAHIDTWFDSTLYNGSLSWLKLSSGDPDFQCGTFSCSEEASEWVSFNWFFDSPPTVFVGLSKFDIGTEWHASVYATDISNTGFTIHAEKGSDTDFYGCAVTWVAVVDGKEGVLCGTFGGSSTTDSGYSGWITFSPTFNHTPTIFTAFKKFNLDQAQNFRIEVKTTAHITGMEWEINTWAGSTLYEVDVAYLALDCYY